MREYEFTFIVQPEISDEGLEALCARFDGVLEKGGATKLFYDDWGRRRLAYEIQRFQKGHYLVLYFLDEGKIVPQIERTARLDDAVLRFLTVLANEKVVDIETRKAEAVQLEEERHRKAAERAAREAEEAVAREAEAAAAAAEAEARAEADDSGESDATTDEDDDEDEAASEAKSDDGGADDEDAERSA